MQAYGYHLVGTSLTVASDYIPSLIGVPADTIFPGVNDTYYEARDLPPEALDITAISITRLVNYDSLPNARDPIVAVKAGSIGYYHTLSELTTMLEEAGATDALEMVKKLRRTAHA